MKQEEEKLLLKDLCARLAYRVKFEYGNIESSVDELYDIGYGGEGLKIPVFNHCYGIDEIKPYLRPLSSMTEEERREYKHLVAFSGNPDGTANLVDWLNKKMFAYRTIDGKDMFELGLALEAPEGMYDLKINNYERTI